MGDRLLIPAALRKLLTAKLYQAHVGIQSTLRRARTSVLWPGMKVQLKQFIASSKSATHFRQKTKWKLY